MRDASPALTVRRFVDVCVERVQAMADMHPPLLSDHQKGSS
jgi:hypothetical protein